MSEVSPQLWEVWHARFNFDDGRGYKFRPVIVVGVGHRPILAHEQTNPFEKEVVYVVHYACRSIVRVLAFARFALPAAQWNTLAIFNSYEVAKGNPNTVAGNCLLPLRGATLKQMAICASEVVDLAINRIKDCRYALLVFSAFGNVEFYVLHH